MNYIDHLNLFGVDAKEIPCIRGSGAPTTETTGAVGLFYMNTDTGDTYKCTEVAESGYVWNPLDVQENLAYMIYDGFTSWDGALYAPDATKLEKTSEYIKVNVGDSFLFQQFLPLDVSNAVWIGCCYYRANWTFIKRETVTVATTTDENKVVSLNITIPDDCAYIRVSGRTWGLDAVSFSLTQTNTDGLKPYITPAPSPPQTMIIPAISGDYPIVSTTNETVTFQYDTVIIDRRLANGYVSLNTAAQMEISYSTVSSLSSACYIYYDIVNKMLKCGILNDVGRANGNMNILLMTIRHVVADRNPGRLNGCEVVCPCPVIVDGRLSTLPPSETIALENGNVNSVNHRGYCTIAPENTLPAYKLSKRMGFKYVECDVSFTSDGVAVLLHDNTIDRTSDGSGDISTMTYEEALQYDFGSWKSANYEGTKIPTFEKFIKLCRNLGLHPYIELKSGTETQIQSVVELVKKNGMRGKVTYISFSATLLEYVKNYDATARLGFLVSTVSADTITTAQSLKTDNNEVFIDAADYSEDAVTLCMNADLPLEIWTINSETTVNALPAYVTGVTSDNVIAAKTLYIANEH